MMHAMDDAVMRYLADTPNSNSYLALSYEKGRNIAEAEQMGRSIGLYMKEVIPIAKIAFESLLIGLFPLVVLALLISESHKILFGYIFSLINIYCWDPALALINGFVNISAIEKLHTALEAAGAKGALTLSSYTTIMETLDFMPAQAGYLAIIAPTTLYLLMKGGEVGLSGLVSQMVAPVMGKPPHAESADTIQTQKIADAAGRPFGEVEFAKWTELQQKAIAWKMQNVPSLQEVIRSTEGQVGFGIQKGLAEFDVLNELGRDAVRSGLEGSFKGSAVEGAATNEFLDIYGISRATNIATAGKFINAAETKGKYVGAGGDMGRIEKRSQFETELGIERAASMNDIATGLGGINSLANLMVASDNATANFVKDAFGGNVGRYANEYLNPQMQKSFGEIKGDIQAFNSLKESGHLPANANYSDYRALQSAISGRQSFENLTQFNNSMKDLADTHFGGNINKAYEASAVLTASRIGGLLNNIYKHGYNANTYGELESYVGLANNLKQSAVINEIGEKGYIDTATGEAVIGAERIKALRAFAGDDDAKFNKLAAAMGRNVSLSLDDKEAKTFGLKDGAGHYNLSFGDDNKPVLIKAEEGKDVHKMDNVVEEKRRLEIEDYGLRKTDAKKIDTMDTNLSGTRKEKVDIDNVIKERITSNRKENITTNFTKATVVGDFGVTDGYFISEIDPETGKEKVFMVAGNQEYGINQSRIEWDESKKGYVFKTAHINPETGKEVSATYDSLIMYKGAITDSEGTTYKGTMFKDSNSGRQLFAEGETGKVFSKTMNEEAWTIRRDLKMEGGAIESTITKMFGTTAGTMAGQMKDTIKDGYNILNPIRKDIEKTNMNKFKVPPSKGLPYDL